MKRSGAEHYRAREKGTLESEMKKKRRSFVNSPFLRFPRALYSTRAGVLRVKTARHSGPQFGVLHEWRARGAVQMNSDAVGIAARPFWSGVSKPLIKPAAEEERMKHN